jgi:hypothetical protein
VNAPRNRQREFKERELDSRRAAQRVGKENALPKRDAANVNRCSPVAFPTRQKFSLFGKRKKGFMTRTTVSNNLLSGLALLMATLAFAASRLKGRYGFWSN